MRPCTRRKRRSATMGCVQQDRQALFPTGVPLTACPPDEYKNYCLAQGQMFQTHKWAGANSGGIPGTAKHAEVACPILSVNYNLTIMKYLYPFA
jgi:hypothetical protein